MPRAEKGLNHSIAFPIEWPDLLGGMANSVADLAIALAHRRFVEPIVVCPGGALQARLERSGVRARIVGGSTPWPATPVGISAGRRSAAISRRLRAELRLAAPSVMHVNSIPGGVLAIPYIRERACPLVFQYRGLADVRVRSKMALRYLFSKADQLVAATEQVKDFLVREGASEHCIEVIPNAVSLVGRTMPLCADARDALGIPLDAFVCLAVGRAVHLKGLDIACRAFAELALKQRDAYLFILAIGDGEEHHRLRRALSDHLDGFGLHTRYQIRSAYTPIEVPLAAADVFWNTARTESFGRVIVEAMAAGVPVVATAVGGVPSVVGDAAILLSQEDYMAFAQVTATLADRRDQYDNWVRAGLDRCQVFAPDGVAARFEDLYRRLV